MAPLSTLPLALALAAAAAAKSPAGREHSRASDAARAAMRDEAAAPHASPRAIAHYLRARVALVRGDEQEALREMDLAMAFDPSSAGLRAGAADLLLAIGEVGRAAGEAHRAIDLAEREPDAAARGHAVLGRIAAAESRWPAAAAELDAAARLADAPPTAGAVAVSQEDRFVLGVALEALRRWDDAATAFARAASGDDDGIGALSLLRQAHALTRAR
ncbi:MAG TPA: hypothetical protein VFK85_01960, partial [Anaeromyxobacteraceae bacterium]|nr:hypothetical protein [Anaeromyxobacteraceae bacterium]